MAPPLGRPLIVGHRRRLAITTVIVCVVGFLALAMTYHDASRPGQFDAAVDDVLIVESPTMRQVLWGLVLLGEPAVMVALAVAVAVGAALTRWWRATVLALVGPFAAAGLTEFVLKPVVGRTRLGDLAFPSGHTVTIVAVATVLCIIGTNARPPRRPSLRATLALVLAVPPAVMVSLTALDLHYVTDTIGGALVSVAVVISSALLVDVVSDVPTRSASPRGRTLTG